MNANLRKRKPRKNRTGDAKWSKLPRPKPNSSRRWSRSCLMSGLSPKCLSNNRGLKLQNPRGLVFRQLQQIDLLNNQRLDSEVCLPSNLLQIDLHSNLLLASAVCLLSNHQKQCLLSLRVKQYLPSLKGKQWTTLQRSHALDSLKKLKKE